jgi:hypothetical protein
LLVTLIIIPGIVIWFLDKNDLLFYLLITSSSTIPFYFGAANKKRSCKIFGREFRF